MPEKMETEFREVPHGVLYLERVEAAGMAAMTEALRDKDVKTAWSVAKLLRYLSIV